ncbi:hypothetical protein BH10ACT1_BH10ACT1_17090 [soil metagenome]
MTYVLRATGALAWLWAGTVGAPARWVTQLSDDLDDVWEPFLRDER